MKFNQRKYLMFQLKLCMKKLIPPVWEEPPGCPPVCEEPTIWDDQNM